MNDREPEREVYGVGEQENDLWPVVQITFWSDDTVSVRYMGAFVDHDTADEFCRRWRDEPPAQGDIAGFRR